MSVRYKPWESATDYGMHYTFDKAGEGVPMHTHVQPSTYHDVRCIKGSVEVYGDTIDKVVHAGETATFPCYRMHEIRALEDGTEIVNMFINGKPADYAGVPVEQLGGNVDSVLLGRLSFT